MSLVCLKSLLIEARFYLLEPLINILVDIIDSKTPKFTKTRNFTYTIPVLMNREDEYALASQSYCKPCIRFCYNRANNRYSYTPNSDDMILKNIELFDKLTFRYYSKISFAKDTIVSDDICSWHFYAGGTKVANVNCTTIVYAMDKKQIRVEFPEAKI